jgi:glycerol uptake facilitator-like aquaporin
VLLRKAVAEAVGTGLLVLAVVGSGIAASRMSPGDAGLQLLENALATAAALAAIILAIGPVSGAHLNPVVTLADLAVELSTHSRGTGALWLSEVVATFGLLLVILGVVRSGRVSVAPFAVAAYIGGAYFFTSSTSFANPAVTAARSLSDTFAGIHPGSVPAFVACQLAGAGLALALMRFLYPPLPDEIVLDQEMTDA